MIEDYSFGTIQVDGKVFQHDVIIFRGQVDSWWRVRGHEVVEKDIVNILRQRPQVIVFGTGNSGVMQVSQGVQELIRNRGIDLIIEKTPKAKEKFNELLANHLDTAALLHLTC